MQIKFEAKELKRAKEYVQKLTTREEVLKKSLKKRPSSLFKDLFRFLFK